MTASLSLTKSPAKIAVALFTAPMKICCPSKGFYYIGNVLKTGKYVITDNLEFFCHGSQQLSSYNGPLQYIPAP